MRIVTLVAVSLAVGACAHTGVDSSRLPPGVRAVVLARLDPPGGPFVWRPDGGAVAFSRGGLWVLDLARGTERRLASEAPAALAWSPDGRLIAAALPQKKRTLLRLLSHGGRVRGEARVQGQVLALFWRSPSEVVAAAATLKRYSFGGNYRQLLHRWRVGGKPSTTILADTTIRRRTLDHLVRGSYLAALAPLGDELAYARLQEPPNVAPVLVVILRHLESGAERTVTRVNPRGRGLLFSGDGDRLLVDGGPTGVRWYDPWLGRAQARIVATGPPLARSPSGALLVVGEHLLREGRIIGDLPGARAARFSPAGGGLLLDMKGQLVHIVGLKEPALKPRGAAARSRLLSLRRWRSEGLITPQEYQRARERTEQR